MINLKYLKEFNRNPSANEKMISKLNFLKKLPNDYIELIKEFNGGEGLIGDEYLILYRANELERINTEYKIKEFDSQIFIIGSNGGGEVLAIDTRNKKTKYILIPLLFEYDAIIELGDNWIELIKVIYKNGFF